MPRQLELDSRLVHESATLYSRVIVHLRPVIALGLTLTLLATTMPAARAQEIDSSARTSFTPDVRAPRSNDRIGMKPLDVLTLTSDALAPRTSAMLTRPRLSDPVATDIRLSRGAKTAIIVTAIVVGALLIIGVVAVSKPHRL